MTYRQDIQGLRGLAVASVILYHAGVPTLGGGFIGVDVFFVISGYLITSIITAGLGDGSFSLASFYKRRARRILPALFFVLFCTMPFAWLWLMPGDFENYSQSLIASVLSYSNVHFWSETGYFSKASELVPLLHTWSLAVEEQFYLVFAPLALVAWRYRGRRGLLATILGLAAVSLALCLWGAGPHPAATFYLLPARGWELLAGGLASFARPSGSRGLNESLSLGGLMAIVGATFLIDTDAAWPSAWTLVPVLATCLVLVFATRDTIAARLLSVMPLVGLGQISYSAYLWHQPIFAFARIQSLEPPGLAMMLALTGLTLGLSIFSWHIVEEPLRHASGTRAVAWRPFAAGLGMAAVAISAVAVSGTATNGFPGRLPASVEQLEDDSGWSRTCLYTQEAGLPAFPLTGCLFNAGHPIRYAIWGDSVASSLAPELAARLDREGIALQQLTHGHCAPLTGIYPADMKDARNCGAFNDAALKDILSSGTKGVVMAASWTSFLGGQDYMVDGTSLRLNDGSRNLLADRLAQTIRTLEDAGVSVVLVYPHPTAKTDVSESVGRVMLKGDAYPTVEIPDAQFELDTAASRAILDRAAGPNTRKVLPEDRLCDEGQGGECRLASGGIPYLSDKIHFTRAGAAIVVEQVIDRMFPERADRRPLADLHSTERSHDNRLE